MKNIGFIDYYLNEWHADNYPEWIKKASNGEYTVKYAYGKIDSPKEGGLSNAEWAKQHNIELLSSIQEVVEKSDCIIVLSPDNAEMHEELCQIPLASGKCVFVDKTFTESKKVAQDLFDLAQKHNTPMFTTSALRYAQEYDCIKQKEVRSINSFGGGGSFEIYCIHQIEPIVMLMGSDVKQVMCVGNSDSVNMVMQWNDSRVATFTFDMKIGCYEMVVTTPDEIIKPRVESDIFAIFIKDLIDFFEKGTPKVKAQDTIAIMGIREACIKAKNNVGVWIEV